MSLAELASGLEDGSLVLVDVREPHEFAAGHIPGSVSLPLSRFDPAALPAAERIVFSCAAGVRSQVAVDQCRASGLRWSEHYPGGFKGWISAGMPAASGDA